MSIVNIYRSKTQNIGDLVCAPHNYFPFLGNNIIDVMNFSKPNLFNFSKDKIQIAKNDKLIIGGGGLFNRKSFDKSLKHLISKYPENIVIWGAGHNSPDLVSWKNFKTEFELDLKNLPLVGVRDFGTDLEWVPCSSCMNTHFDRHYDIVREIGVITHHSAQNTSINDANLFHNYEKISNNADLNTMMEFIGQSEVILTDSFHAMYWAILFNKKVIVFPNSSKMYNSKYPVPLCAPADYKNFMKMAIQYPEALDECRERNISFSKKVKNFTQR